ncbi:LRR domain containing protein [Trema orientale]|uniref:LRR domain containing protein n=1 Tax=Trema orientale TaxID=63057 RepID=A0A2P5F479_TREOI|nr:LRR domain containing protein [Trema orientale]
MCKAERTQGLERWEFLLDLKLTFDGVLLTKLERREDEIVLETLQPHPNLKSLEISSYDGTTIFPSWMMSLTNLKRLSLDHCPSCKCLPPLGKLPSLASLHIAEMSSITQVRLEFLGIEATENNATDDQWSENRLISSSFVSFPKLKELSFASLHNWKRVGMEQRLGQIRSTILSFDINHAMA